MDKLFNTSFAKISRLMAILLTKKKGTCDRVIIMGEVFNKNRELLKADDFIRTIQAGKIFKHSRSHGPFK